MSRSCPSAGCFAGDGEACALGHLNLTDCPQWAGFAPTARRGAPAAETAEHASPEPGEPAADNDAYTIGVPWSGSALGLGDMFNLTPAGRTIVIGVIGPHDAGKTTLLVGTYLKLLDGQRLLGARFAGSRTLGAWESMAAWARFDDPDRMPTFPPHTSRAAARTPGLLHLALRGGDESRRDILLSDAPGEWFQRWAVNADDPQAEGARWLTRHADGFIVVADSERLSGERRGEARGEQRRIIERLGNVIAERPALLVWAKSDKVVPPGIRRSIRRCLGRHIPQATESACNNAAPDTLAGVIREIVERCWDAPKAAAVSPPTVGDRPFQVYRGHR